MDTIGIRDLDHLEPQRRPYAPDAPYARDEPKEFEVIERRHA
jgi:hypothetical protein